MTRISKFKIYILFVLAANLVAYTFYCGFYKTAPNEIQLISNQQNSPNAVHLESSRPLKKNIFFLKTHKTASSTVQNILMRFGYRHSLNFMLPGVNNYLGYLKQIEFEDMDPDSVPSDKKFHVFAHHSRYRPETNHFLYPDAVRVTILRDPAELFESLFNFYHLQKVFHVSLVELIDSIPRVADVKISDKRKIHGHNQMSRDLGLERGQYGNESEISQFIRFVDEQFDLVMIREHMEASLVLLADFMAWPLHYVAFLPLNVRKNSTKNRLTDTDRFKLSQYNRADYLLYEHFLDKFRQRVLEYGFEKLAADVQKLHSINAELKRRCILKEDYSGLYRTVKYILKDTTDWECAYSAMEELAFTNELRAEQIRRLKPVKRLEKFLRDRPSER